MKGISLPVNTVIVISVAVLVLGLISMFFSSSTGTSTRAISHADAWNRGCSQANARGCLVNDFGGLSGIIIAGYDPNGDGVNDYLWIACKNFFANNGLTAADCRAKCCGG